LSDFRHPCRVFFSGFFEIFLIPGLNENFDRPPPHDVLVSNGVTLRKISGTSIGGVFPEFFFSHREFLSSPCWEWRPSRGEDIHFLTLLREIFSRYHFFLLSTPLPGSLLQAIPPPHPGPVPVIFSSFHSSTASALPLSGFGSAFPHDFFCIGLFIF